MKLAGPLGFAIGGLFILVTLLGASRGSLSLAVVFMGLGLLAALVMMLPPK